MTDCSDFSANDTSLYPIHYWTHSAGIAAGSQLSEPHFLAELYAIAAKKNNSTFFKEVAGTTWELVGINTLDGLCTLHQKPSLTMSPRVETLQFCESTGQKARVYHWTKPTKTPGASYDLAQKTWTKMLCTEGNNAHHNFGGYFNLIALDPPKINKAPACQTHKSCVLFKHEDFSKDKRLKSYQDVFPFSSDLLLCAASHADKDNVAIPRFEIYVRRFSQEFKQDPFSCIRA